jgi:ADP-heptose:LPS heptosyltransferase
MLNILIIPPVEAEKADRIIFLTETIKKNYPDCSISVITNLTSYELYYKAESIDGLIVDTGNLFSRLRLLVPGHYHVVLKARSGLLWVLLILLARIKKAFDLSKTLENKSFSSLILELGQIKVPSQ